MKENSEQTCKNNAEINELSAEVNEMTIALPKVLFASKSLPHPSETGSKTKNNEVESTAIDIKKEIAFSILNVGEVIAKTIDYYSNDPETPEMKNLIEISSRQSQNEIDTKLNKSPSSSLVISTSSASIGSIQQDVIDLSPSQKLKPKDSDNDKQDLPAEPSTPVPPPELNLEHTSTVPCDSNSTPEKHDFSDEIVIAKENKNEIFGDDDFHRIGDKASIQPETKSSSSSSDVLSNNDEVLIEVAASDINNKVSNEEPASNPVVFRNGENLATTNSDQSQMTKQRMSLDEELYYNLAEVDKKVKYMNETCSEDDGDDDDDLDDENFDYDESVELENANDERLFCPKTPAKIKSEVRNNRTVDLQEEIKQISNVIQDLVQTINVRNSTNTSGTDGANSGDNKSSLENSDTNNVDSEDGSQNSGSGGDYKTKSYHYNRNSSGSHTSGSINDRKNINSRRSVGNQSLNSSIPISVSRQKIMKKGGIENESELINSVSTNNSFVDFNEPPGTPEVSSLNNSSVNKSASSQRFRSKLPVKK